MQMFDSQTLPPDDGAVYRKKVFTRAWRIAGPFRVETSEGPVVCKDGYLARDARGYYYPINKEEFELIYEPVDEFSLHPSTTANVTTYNTPPTDTKR